MKVTNFIIAFSFYIGAVSAQNIDVKHTKLTLNFDWQKKQAMGFAEITFSMSKQNNSIVLDAGFLGIEEISIGAKSLAYKYDGGDSKGNLLLNLDKTYNINEILTIKINYHTNHENKADPNAIGGSFGKGLRFFQPTSTTPTKRKQIWSSGEPESNK